MRQYKKAFHAVLIGILLLMSSGATATAAQSSSANYSVDETFFGSGGELNACSTNYCSKQAAGETAVGNSSSTNYQIQAGNNTFRDNSLEVIVPLTFIDVGRLTTTATKVGSATFSVKSYLATGYAVRSSSPGPANISGGTHVLQLLSTAANSATGTEQFGINLVANSCPANTSPAGIDGKGGCNGGLGADPVEVPDTSFAYGHAATGYDTPDTYKYQNGDTIAYSNQSSGETDYTMSYIFNISAVTPGGSYIMHQSLVVTSTF